MSHINNMFVVHIGQVNRHHTIQSCVYTSRVRSHARSCNHCCRTIHCVTLTYMYVWVRAVFMVICHGYYHEEWLPDDSSYALLYGVLLCVLVCSGVLGCGGGFTNVLGLDRGLWVVQMCCGKSACDHLLFYFLPSFKIYWTVPGQHYRICQIVFATVPAFAPKFRIDHCSRTRSASDFLTGSSEPISLRAILPKSVTGFISASTETFLPSYR